MQNELCLGTLSCNFLLSPTLVDYTADGNNLEIRRKCRYSKGRGRQIHQLRKHIMVINVMGEKWFRFLDMFILSRLHSNFYLLDNDHSASTTGNYVTTAKLVCTRLDTFSGSYSQQLNTKKHSLSDNESIQSSLPELIEDNDKDFKASSAYSFKAFVILM